LASTATDQRHHVLLTALARSLFATPQANRVWRDGQFEEFQTVDIGLAVDTERGLLAPLLRDVGRVPLDSIAAGAKRLVERAKNGELTITCTRRRDHCVQCWHASG
jgi:pyruvate dehydrogenase E2 component (dihydrolipoamide acetyltransferase)